MQHLKLFDPYNTNEKELRSYYNCKVKREKFNNVPFNLSFDKWTSNILRHLKSPDLILNVYLLFEGDDIVGNIDTHLLNKGKKEEIQQIDIHLQNEYKAQYWSQYNLENHVNKWKINSKLTKFVSDNNILKQQLKSIGFKTSNQKVYLKCDISDLNNKYIDEVLPKNVVKNNKLNIEILSSLTKENCNEIAPVLTDLLNDMERNDMSEKLLVDSSELFEINHRNNKAGNQYYHLLLRDNEDNLVGLDTIKTSKSTPDIIWQLIAGVIPNYRNKGITTWMKAHIYKKLIGEHPTLKEIRTDCYKDNKAIVHINKKMGFKIYKEVTDMLFYN